MAKKKDTADDMDLSDREQIIFKMLRATAARHRPTTS